MQAHVSFKRMRTLAHVGICYRQSNVMSTKAAPHHVVHIQDSGTTWVQRGSRENWVTVAASSDGSRLVAIKENYGMRGEGGIYVSVCQCPRGHNAGVARGQAARLPGGRVLCCRVLTL